MTTADRLKSKPGVIGATIILRSGHYFDYLDPENSMICAQDIAWGLANTCRFGGQSLHYYSVAQHSVLVSHLVPPEHAQAGLMHDAAEAYVGDIVGPLKQLLPDYKAIEDRIEKVVAARFGLSVPWDPAIKHADLRALRTEQRDLTAGRADNWNGLDQYQPADEVIQPLLPADAALLFLNRFAELFPGHI